MNIRFTCEYNGKNYHGFQRQSNGASIQGELESALGRLFNADIKITAAGRTDAGVHAFGMVCNFHIEGFSANERSLFKLATGMNAFLSHDIVVRDFAVAPDDFNARKSAKQKTYVYKYYVNPHRSPLRENHMAHIYKMPNIEKMAQAAGHLVGRHDFTSFCCTDCDKPDKVRTVRAVDVHAHADEITITVVGDGFLRNMVRVIAGTLLEVGQGTRNPSDIAGILAARDRNAAGLTAPACGLCLVNVTY
ncbi:MAG: tRNA pseudouridine(38-40) synthase TruA [Firmicutes bacterium]|nr:tRNA pseudouridine(38-40) synthase TruA [Bacillota bacterium]